MAPRDEERPSAAHDEVATIVAPTKRGAHATAAATYTLVVVAGADRGKSLTLDGTSPSRVLLGSGPACALPLSDRMVSRRHLALELDGKRLRVTDLESTNGTTVDGVTILDALLHGGETIRIGETSLRVDLVSSSTTIALSAETRFGAVVGQSTEMRRLYPLCAKLAASTVPVIIEGETGTGKEVLAESIHGASARASGPFVVFDCTTVAPNLMESELFGHERGAFTGAVSARKGLFEQAHGGTIFIDEIGDLDLTLQPKLLRAIEKGEVRRVGGNKSIKVDVRVLSATRRDLDREIQAGRFRDDLFFRLAVARIELPPLRRRHGDVAVLAKHFIAELGGGGRPLPFEVLQRFEDYAWPGNVRELHNAVARWLALGELAPAEGARTSSPSGPSATPTLPSLAGATSGDAIERVLERDLPLPRARQEVVEEFERRYIERVLSRHGGNVVHAAAASGIARRYFQIIRARQAK